MADFDPDSYLSQPSQTTSSFDPDAYLAGKGGAKPFTVSGALSPITDIGSEIGNEFSAGVKQAKEGLLSKPESGITGGLKNIADTASGLGGLARAGASWAVGPIKSVAGHALAGAERFAGEDVVNPIAEHVFGVPHEKLPHPDPDQMYEKAKGDVDTALSAMPAGADIRNPIPPRPAPPAMPTPPTGPFGVTLTEGERTGDLAARQAEQAALRGQAGKPAQEHAEEFLNVQRPSQLDQAREDVARGLDPHQGVLAENSNEAANIAQQSLQSESARQKADVNNLFTRARSLPGEIDADTFKDMPITIREELERDPTNPITIDERTPNAARMLKYLTDKVGELKIRNDAALNSPIPSAISGVTLNGAEQWRQVLSGMRSDAIAAYGSNPTDARAARAIMESFNRKIGEAVNSPAFHGDPYAQELFNQGRAASSQYKGTWGNDAIGKRLQAIIGDPARSKDPAALSDVANYIYSSSGTSPNSLNVGVAKRIKNILGEDSSEWSAIRQGLFHRLVSTPEGVADRGPGAIANRLSEFLNGKGSDLAGVVFTPAQRDLLNRYADLHNQLKVPQVAANWPNTAAGIIPHIRKAADKILGVVGALIGEHLMPGWVGGATGYAAGHMAAKAFDKVEYTRNLRQVAKQMPLLSYEMKQWQNAMKSQARAQTAANATRVTLATEKLVRSLSGLGVDSNLARKLLTVGQGPQPAEADQKRAQGGRVAAEKALPKNHQLGMRVPKGGSSCSTCFFFDKPNYCRNVGFIAWNHNSNLIPGPPDEYCCDNYKHTFKRARGGKLKFNPIDSDEDPTDRLADEMIEDAKHFDRGGIAKHFDTGGTPTDDQNDDQPASFDDRFDGLNNGQGANFNQRFIEPPKPSIDTGLTGTALSSSYADRDNPPAPSYLEQAGDLAGRFGKYVGQAASDVYNLPSRIYQHPEDLRDTANKLLGTGGQERYQTWPERMVRSGFTLPHDVMTGEEPFYTTDPVSGEQVISPKIIERTQDLAGMAGTGGLANMEEGAVLNATPSLRPALKYQGKIYKAPPGGEHMDAIPPQLRDTFQQQAMSGDDISNFEFGFMNHKGHFLNREDALDYGVKEGLIDPRDARFGTLTSTMDYGAKPSGPKLTAAYKNKDTGEVIAAPEGGGHISIDKPENSVSGFVDETGRFMDRGQALAYGKKNNLFNKNEFLDPHEGAWSEQLQNFKDYSLKHENDTVLRSDTSEPGAAIAGLNDTLYHGTTGPHFDRFKTDDFGPHFGTARQANARLTQKLGGNDRLIPVNTEFKNPLLMEDFGDWSLSEIADNLRKLPEFKNDRAKIDQLSDSKIIPYQERLDRLRGLIKSKGYDSVKYLNRYEGFKARPDHDRIIDSELSDDQFKKIYPDADYSYIPLQPTSVKSKLTGQTLFSDSSKPASVIAGLAKTSKPFYSAVENTIESAPQSKMHGVQWANWLKNQPGVKGEELEHTGLDNWLRDQKGPVTKDQVRDFFNQNKVDVNDVMKGAPFEAPHIAKMRDEFQKLNDKAEEVEKKGGQLSQPEYDRMHELSSELMNYPNPWLDKAADTKYSSYQLPGGENYREHLLTLPEKEFKPVLWKDAPPQLKEEFAKKYDKLTPGELEHFFDARAYKDARTGQNGNLVTGDTYRSSHWDEPNVLAHVRSNERDVGGVPSLHLEEIQSDWHQAGRKRGYQQVLTEDITKAKAEMDAAAQRAAAKHQDKPIHEGIQAALRDPEYLKAAEIYRQKVGQYEESRINGVPNAPFKTSWPELALKRMIRLAAEEGKSRISWTPGEAQAARYDLSKTFNNILTTRQKDGTFEIAGKRMGRDSYESLASYVPAEKLSDYIGKDLADKINNDYSKIDKDEISAKQQKVYSGLDLKVGGEGMKGFYDKMLPKMVEKLGKKYGVKVKEDYTNTDDFTKFDFVHENGGWQIIDKGMGKKIPGSPSFKNGADAEKWLKNEGLLGKKVHYFDIPEKMKQDVLSKGFSLFSDSSKPGAALAGLEQSKVVDLGARREQKEIGKFHKNLMSEVADSARERANIAQEYHENGKLPFAVGTRFSTEHSRRQGLLPLEVTDHYVDRKNPEKYGYYYKRGPGGEEESGVALVNDPARPNVAELSKQFVPFTRVQRVRARGGRVIASNINHEPTEAQKEVGNYKKEHIHILGLPITIENAKGSYRTGIGANKKEWRAQLAAHYGYVIGHDPDRVADGDHVDVYVGPHIRSKKVWVINQIKANKQFDEYKVMIGFASMDQALQAYTKSFSDGKGKARIGSIVPTDIDTFKYWLKHGDLTKPYRESSTYGKVEHKGVTVEQQV